MIRITNNLPALPLWNIDTASHLQLQAQYISPELSPRLIFTDLSISLMIFRRSKMSLLGHVVRLADGVQAMRVRLAASQSTPLGWNHPQDHLWLSWTDTSPGRPRHYWSQPPHLQQFCVNGDVAVTICRFVDQALLKISVVCCWTQSFMSLNQAIKCPLKNTHSYKQGGVLRKAKGESW